MIYFSKGTHQAQMFWCQYVGTSTPLKSPAKASMFIWDFPPMTRISTTTQGLVFNSKLLVNSSLNLSSLYLKNFTSDMLFSCNYMKIMGNQLRRFFLYAGNTSCPPGWRELSPLKCFKIMENPLDGLIWSKAQEYCGYSLSNLIVIPTDDIFTDVQGMSIHHLHKWPF